MKISYSWIKEHINLDLSSDELAEILTSIGLEVESITKSSNIIGDLEGIVVGRIIDIDQHPNADRLRVTKVDVGGEILNIVCGAPNVKKNITVPIAKIGTTLQDGDKKFKIKRSKLRGVVSEGMICSEKEINLGSDDDGIMILDDKFEIGTKLIDFYKSEFDFLFEIGLTPNRCDAMSHLGVARDINAYLNFQSGKSNQLMKDYDKISGIEFKNKLDLNVSVQNDNCLRYSGLIIKDLKIKESPDWLKKRLTSIGVKSINNVVDITNYVLHDIGQPLHAFDYNKINGKEIIVRNARNGEKIVTLDEINRDLINEDLLICNYKNPMCIAGVMGGIESSVNLETKSIFLESALFDQISVRKSAKKHSISSDASFRFERGVDPSITIKSLKYAASLISDICETKEISEIIDIYPKEVIDKEINFSIDNLSKICGFKVNKSDVLNIFSSLDIKILEEIDNNLKVSIPSYRYDVNREIDLVEEYLRIYGYNSYNSESVNISYNFKESLQQNFDSKLTKNINHFFVSNGFSEAMSNSLVNKELNMLFTDESKIVNIINPKSKELNSMRSNMLISALSNISYNFKRNNKDIRLFEFGKTYLKEDDNYNEKENLIISLSNVKEKINWNKENKLYDFYDLKEYLDKLLQSLSIDNLKLINNKKDYFEYGLSYFKGDLFILEIGKISVETSKNFDIKNDVFCSNINLENLSKIVSGNNISFSPFSKFPSVRRDLSFYVQSDINYDKIEKSINELNIELITSVSLFDVYSNKKDDKKSYSIYITFQHLEKTLTDFQIDKCIDRILTKLKSDFSIEIRDK
ncbi:phenylalanine--tRNA ligase subunit beta [Bacteroidota bacterium]|nr:phenylalanine--tRNA ligase subunit beta [Bacteroidota bacterium]